MHDPLRFRRDLAARILGFLGAASLGACTGGGAKGTSSGNVTTTQGTTTTSADAGAGGAGGAGSGTAGGGGMGGADPNPPLTACFLLPIDAGADVLDFDAGAAPGTCPTDTKTVINDFAALGCPDGWEPISIVAGPTKDAQGQCCYSVHLGLCGPGGRPFLVSEQSSGARGPGRDLAGPSAQPATALVAELRRGPAARGWASGDGPVLAGLTSGERAALAAAWTRDALFEHASVASFARFSLALMAAGAPADLVELAHRAALDEVRHAQLCFALASAYAGEALSPGPFPLGAAVSVEASLAELAVATFEEGCLGETLAAVQAAEQLARATDPAVCAALAEIAEDEARHAELAWRTVAWAVQTGGSEVRAAVARRLRHTLETAGRAGGQDTPGPGTPISEALAAHGRLDAATAARAAASAMTEILVPATSMLWHVDTVS